MPMTFTTIPVAFIAVVLLATCGSAEALIGMNWGRTSAQRLVPSQVVDLMLQNGIGNARLFSSEYDILDAFSGSGINLTVGIDTRVMFRTMELGRAWVQTKASHFVDANVRGVTIGDNVFYMGLSNKTFLHEAMDALRCTQAALNEVGFNYIKANFQHINAILNNRTKPSEAEFREEIKEEMAVFVRFLKENDAPFLIELFPIYDTIYTGFDLSFAFLDNRSTVVVKDVNGTVYTNAFEFVYDSFAWALEKLNAPDMKIVVAKIGWPTDGYPGASMDNAERFFRGLLPHVASNKGTPKRPGEPIDVFIHSLTDENKLDYKLVFPFMRHWGIYRSNGEPKYKIDLSGQGRDIFPTTVKGIMQMPRRWCMFNGNKTDIERVETQFQAACRLADCTSLAPGGSCSHLSYDDNVSYAFNMHFQFQYQNEAACIFDGLGRVMDDDPSTPECVFPVEVVKGHQKNYKFVFGEGERLQYNFGIVVVFLLAVMEILIWELQ